MTQETNQHRLFSVADLFNNDSYDKVLSDMRSAVPVENAGQKALFSEKQILKNLPTVDKLGKLAILPMYGNLISGLDPMSEALGRGFNPERIMDLAVGIKEDSSITNVLIDVRSFGGDVMGARELFTTIRDLAKVKDVTAYGPAICSAAYWAVSGSTRIIGGPSGLYGSIGVAEQKDTAVAGRFVTFRSGKKKMVDVDVTTMSEADKGVIQERVDAMAQVFWEDITVTRPGLTSQEGQIRQGGIFVGQSAVDNGLLDGMEDSINNVIDRVRDGTIFQIKIGENLMANENPQNGQPQPQVLTEEMKQQLIMQGYQQGVVAARAEGVAPTPAPQPSGNPLPQNPNPVPQPTPSAGGVSDWNTQQQLLQVQVSMNNLLEQSTKQRRKAIANNALAMVQGIKFPAVESGPSHFEALKARAEALAISAPSDEEAQRIANEVVGQQKALVEGLTPTKQEDVGDWHTQEPGSGLLAATGGDYGSNPSGQSQQQSFGENNKYLTGLI